jgi:hypothetical protein
MKAVLVATIGEDKLYYILDAEPSKKDGAVERADGEVVMVDMIPFISTARGLKKIRTSKFHRKLWDSPRNTGSGSWYETFVEKSKEVDDKMLEGVPTYSALGKDRKKSEKIKQKSLDFLDSGITSQILNKSAASPMVKFDKQNYAFKTLEQRREAWLAMCLLRQIEENNNA